MSVSSATPPPPPRPLSHVITQNSREQQPAAVSPSLHGNASATYDAARLCMKLALIQEKYENTGANGQIIRSFRAIFHPRHYYRSHSTAISRPLVQTEIMNSRKCNVNRDSCDEKQRVQLIQLASRGRNSSRNKFVASPVWSTF